MNNVVATLLAEQTKKTAVAELIKSVCESYKESHYGSSNNEFEDRLAYFLINPQIIKSEDVDPDKIEDYIKHDGLYNANIVDVKTIRINFIDSVMRIVKVTATLVCEGYFADKDSKEARSYNSYKKYSVERPYKHQFEDNRDYIFDLSDINVLRD